jgi:hypothetical protein
MRQVDPRIAAYVAEVEQPGIPYVSTSHIILRHLYGQHGKDVIDALLAAHWKRCSLAAEDFLELRTVEVRRTLQNLRGEHDAT